MRHRLPALLIVLLASHGDIVANAEIAPAGPEFVVNSYTRQSQRMPDIARLAGGGFVVVWESNHTGVGADDIVARSFNAAGTPTHPDFRVNGYAHGLQLTPAVAGMPGGNYVVVWTDADRDLVAGRILRGRTGITADFDVTFDDSPYLIRGPDTTVLADGSFVVVWNAFENGLPFPTNAVLVRRFFADGAAEGQTRRIAELGNGTQAVPSLARLNATDVLVTWLEEQSIFAKRYDTDVGGLGIDLTVATGVVAGGFPSAAASTNGNIVIVWERNTDVFGRLFDAKFEPLTSEFRINTYTLATQERPVVTFDGTGGFVVVWSTADRFGPGQDGSGSGVFAREFAADATPQTNDFRINEQTLLPQRNPSIVYLPPSSLMVVWDSQEQDGSAEGIMGRRFEVSDSPTTTTLPEPDPCGDAVEDGVITTADALLALRTAIGADSCALCRCDADGSGTITASDAVIILKLALGNPAQLNCPPCAA